MKLYYSKGACSFAVRIIINEIELSSQYESVDLKAKLTETGADYTKINSKGGVPALETNDGEILTENAVIQQYLADTYNAEVLLPSVGKMSRYRVLELLNYIATELHKGCSPLFNPNLDQKIKDEIFIPALKAKLNYMNKKLQNQSFLMGKEFTLPDAYFFVILNWLQIFKMDVNEWSNLARYFEELKKRRSISISMLEEGLT